MESRKERADRYRREAARLRSGAETTGNPEIRRQILAVAQQYEDLAATLSGYFPVEGRLAKAHGAYRHALFLARGNVPDAPDGCRTLRALPPACGSIPGMGGERTQPTGSRRLDRYGIAIRSAGRRTHGQNRSGPSGEAGLSSLSRAWPLQPRAGLGSRHPPRLRAKASLSVAGLDAGITERGTG
jgi:hypothetical protein